MKVRVTLQDLKGQNRPEHDFWTSLPELPQVGDLIVQYQHEDEEDYNQWYPDLQEFGASEFFKVVLRLTPKPSGFGIITRNNEGIKKRDLYYNSIDQVERITGIDFFSALPDDIEDEVEAKVNLKDWR